MRAIRGLSPSLLLVGLLSSCGGYSNTCSITATITPATASADPSAAPPGNQAQFSLQSSVSGNCPYIADQAGTWSTSDTTNTNVSQQGLATCTTVVPAAVKATISYSGTVRGRPFTSASLTCQ